MRLEDAVERVMEGEEEVFLSISPEQLNSERVRAFRIKRRLEKFEALRFSAQKVGIQIAEVGGEKVLRIYKKKDLVLYVKDPKTGMLVPIDDKDREFTDDQNRILSKMRKDRVPFDQITEMKRYFENENAKDSQ